jgi:hypothetical protein
MFVVIVVLLCSVTFRTHCVDVVDDRLPANRARMKLHLQQHFSQPRFTDKRRNATRQFLVERLHESGLRVQLQPVYDRDGEQVREASFDYARVRGAQVGANVIATTPIVDTRVSWNIVATHFDTTKNTPGRTRCSRMLLSFTGVNDNGSGCVSLLEVAHMLVSDACARANRTIFVFFDCTYCEVGDACRIVRPTSPGTAYRPHWSILS